MMIDRRLVRVLLLLTAAVVIPAAGAAQNCNYNGTNGSCSVNVASSLTIARILRLTINDTSTSVPAPGTADYNLGYQQFAPLTVTVKANDTWALSIRGTTANWTASGGARPNKPVADLRWAQTAGGPYTATTTSNVQIRTGPRGAATVTTMFYRILWSYALDRPGTYRLTVIYTLTAP